jgi:hypothetical protein
LYFQQRKNANLLRNRWDVQDNVRHLVLLHVNRHAVVAALEGLVELVVELVGLLDSPVHLILIMQDHSIKVDQHLLHHHLCHME